MDYAKYWASATSTADLGETIEQSLRFTGDGRLVGPDTQPTGDYTFACWFKRGDKPSGTSLDTLLSFTGNQSYQMVEPSRTGISSGIATRIGATLGPMADGTMPDSSAWYHICFTVTSNTVTTYINGIKQSTSPTQPSGGSDMCIGSNSTSLQDEALVGYLAEVNLLDGTVIGDTNNILDEFGRVNEDGIWVPKEISFTSSQYGDRGFRLVFDSSADGGIGDDSAPTGTGHTAANDFTATGFDTTAISSSNPDNDIDYEDTPTSNYQTFNPLYPVNSNGPQRFNDANLGIDLSSASSLGYNRFFFSTLKMPSSGKWYFEHTRPSTVDSSDPSLQYPFVGFTTLQDTFASESSNTWQNNISMAGGTGYGYRHGTTSNAVYGPTQGSQTWPIGAVIGCSYDADTGDVRFYNQGTDMGLFDTLPSNTDFYLSAMQIYTHGPAKFNFGQMPFVYTPPTGFEALHLNQLAQPTIKDGRKHFGILTYTGDGATTAGQTVTDTDAVQFTPDLVWIKKRGDNGGSATVREHILVDSVRGKDGSYYWNLSSDSSGNETSADHVSAIGQGSITVHDITSGAVNQNLNTFVAWCWKAGGTAVSNTDGTITSSVSANTTAGFSIVSWTGTQTTSQTVGHGLSEAPDLVIYKARDEAANWIVGSSALGATEYLILDVDNGSASDSTYIPSQPSNTVLNLGSVSSVNNDEKMIAYCWHSVEGYSKFGSYTGGGSGTAPGYDGTFVYLGFRPAFLLVKRTNAAGDPWILLDSTRDATNFAFRGLQPDTTANEPTSGDAYACDFLSNGFKWRSANAGVNSTSATYLYAAFAENPFGGENVPPATARP